MECGESVSLVPTATDNCQGSIQATTSDSLSYSAEGTHVITWVYEDGNGNSAQQLQNVEVLCPVDIEVIKTVAAPDAIVGDTVEFTITASNTGSFDATNIEIMDTMPDGLTYITSDISSGDFDESSFLWEIPVLQIGAMATLNISASADAIGDFTNLAELVYSDQVDDNDTNNRDTATISVSEGLNASSCLDVYNEFSPNGDGLNEVFFIECIDQYPNNNLKVYNRWGNMVYEMNGYNNSWDGISKGRATVNANQKLPVGTYYYILELNDGVTPTRTGWLYINR